MAKHALFVVHSNRRVFHVERCIRTALVVEWWRNESRNESRLFWQALSTSTQRIARGEM